MQNYRLIISCPDQSGIIAKISGLIAKYHGWILEADQHSDLENNWFFMRYEIKVDSIKDQLDAFKHELTQLATSLQITWQLIDPNIPKKILLLASRTPHCLMEILHLVKAQDLFCKIQAVISNHDHLRSEVTPYQLPYHTLALTPDEKDLRELFHHYQPDVIVLARYMQIIPPKLCQEYQGKIINIHHSFLPSFAGGDPYQQAFDRGVKLIGASCHYVTPALDEGPIISQDVVAISHRDSKFDLIREGKNIEKRVLATGLRYHLEDRVSIYGNKTVVFK
ncbi:MAG TPA: formyltetrahydrofolate deformylase [Gammaproteobacteria bacterium]|nr:formyltetrahydrofolate deformylase [Gammaproteobacteria bacterium]